MAGDTGRLEDEPNSRSDPGFEPEREVRQLLRAARSGTLATLAGGGDPFASLVTVATAPDGAPLMLLSQLSSHTRHLDRDPRCSLLLARLGDGDPLTHPRVTLTGVAAKITDAEGRTAAKARFLAKHPKAALYADFGDFAFWRVTMDQVHLNGGFARAARFPARRIVTPVEDAGDLLAAEASAIAHMNQDHAGALSLYAQVFAGQPPGDWRATGLDPEGIDLACGDLTARVAFPDRVPTALALRSTLAAMAKSARAAAEA